MAIKIYISIQNLGLILNHCITLLYFKNVRYQWEFKIWPLKKYFLQEPWNWCCNKFVAHVWCFDLLSPKHVANLYKIAWLVAFVRLLQDPSLSGLLLKMDKIEAENTKALPNAIFGILAPSVLTSLRLFL
jgi:hypothetical protein